MNRHNLLFDECWSFLPYHDPWVEHAVRNIKFGGMAKYARVLGAACAARWNVPQTVEQHATIVTAIPLSQKRERERGFNQAECIAREVAERSGISYERILRRRKATKAQAKLSAEDRQANVADAFQISLQRNRGISRHSIPQGERGRDPASRWPIPRNLELSGKTVILVDDVVTTGATLSEAARTLQRAGAKHIICVTVAYAILEHVG